MPTRPALDYAISRDAMERAVSKTRLPAETVKALAALFTRYPLFPSGSPYVEVSTALLDGAGVTYTEAQREAGGYALFLSIYTLNKDAAVNASRFSHFHLNGSLRATAGLALATSFKTAMEGNVDRTFQAFIQFQVSADLLKVLAARDWATWIARYATLNSLPDKPWPANWASTSLTYLNTYAAQGTT